MYKNKKAVFQCLGTKCSRTQVLKLFLTYVCIFCFYDQGDANVSYDQFKPTIALKGRPQFVIGRNVDGREHRRVFIPQTMVELDEQINGSDSREKSTSATKGIQKEAGVYNEERRHVEKEKAALAQCLGPEIAMETNIEEQVKAMETFEKSKQRNTVAAPDKVVYAGGSSSDCQNPAVQQYYPHSNGQLGRQSSYTQDPHQGSHQPSVVVPAQGDWVTQQPVGIGSTVAVSNSNPPVCGTIRWIGTIPQANGYVAGVELVSVYM